MSICNVKTVKSEKTHKHEHYGNEKLNFGLNQYKTESSVAKGVFHL